MNDRIRDFFQRRMTSTGSGNGEAERAAGAEASEEERARKQLHVAACALLLELAHADDEFSSVERSHIEAVLRRHFALDEPTAQELIELAEAERASAIDLYQFTHLVRTNYDLGQKTLLAEIMWGVILADGRIARHEAYLLRRIANLLDLKPGYLSAARKRAAGED